MYNVAKQHFGRSVDIVVLIAGILDSSDLLNDNDQEEQDGMYRTLQVNLTAAVKANRLAIQHFLREKKPGCIINTSSIYGFCGAPLAPMYSASKHAVRLSQGRKYRCTHFSLPDHRAHQKLWIVVKAHQHPCQCSGSLLCW